MSVPFINNNNFNYLVVDNTLESFLGTESAPSHLEKGGLFFCQEGEALVSIDAKTYRLRKGDLSIAFPNTIIHTIYRSDDFVGFALGVNIDFILGIQIPTSHYLNIKETPCISLSMEEQELLLRLSYELIERNNHPDHPFRTEIINAQLYIICYEIVALFLSRNPIPQQSRSRNDTIFQQFIYYLTKHANKEREVDFYAQLLYLTPHYLSSIVKEKSGMTASQWIAKTVILQAKSLLNSTQLTVQQVAEELNFPNPSFFGQYFKKHTGLTPKGFRKESFGNL